MSLWLVWILKVLPVVFTSGRLYTEGLYCPSSEPFITQQRTNSVDIAQIQILSSFLPPSPALFCSHVDLTRTLNTRDLVCFADFWIFLRALQTYVFHLKYQ